MPRAARKRTAAFLFFALVAVSFVVVTRALAERGFSPTLTGEPAWGDGTRCLQVPPAERPLSIRFDNPKSLDLEQLGVRSVQHGSGRVAAEQVAGKAYVGERGPLHGRGP